MILGTYRPNFVSAAAFDPSHRGWIYLDIAAGDTGTLWFSADFGATWTQKASPPDTLSEISSLAIDPSQPNTLIAVTPDALFVSTDGAASWTRAPHPSPPLNALAPLALVPPGCGPAGGLFALAGAGSTGAVEFSPDYGSSWQSPQFTDVTSVATGPGCAVYVTRQATTDAFVAKLAADGTVLWATYLGGSDLDQPAALATDDQGNVYVAGTTYSPDFPSTAPRIGVPGLESVFVTKYSAGRRIAVVGAPQRRGLQPRCRPCGGYQPERLCRRQHHFEGLSDHARRSRLRGKPRFSRKAELRREPRLVHISRPNQHPRRHRGG